MDRPMKRAFPAVFVNGALAVLTVAALFPLLWMASVSLMPAGTASTLPPPLFPSAPTLAHYQEVLLRAGLLRSLGNSLFLATVVTLCSLAFNTLAGYAFAKLEFAGRERVFRGLASSLLIPGQLALMPLFLMLKNMGLVNTYGGVIVPALASVFGIYLVRQYARTIPDELIEAARIDGAGEFRIFMAVILPLLRPVLASLAIFTFLASWNDFMWPLIVLADDKLQTLPVALASLSREHVQDNELMMAGSVLTVLPVLLLFLALQKHYISGLLAGSVKG
ncbi:MAG: sugar ABC transporter permease [Betaproteobacteria bacterium RIFCSPLOWO2_12_FULL_62_13b]|nr:MAG: sugar ABC transporter permease [Betaproteobacteria bacterium RIFCSPLOWO2_12_FULL_62_13b]